MRRPPPPRHAAAPLPSAAPIHFPAHLLLSIFSTNAVPVLKIPSSTRQRSIWRRGRCSRTRPRRERCRPRGCWPSPSSTLSTSPSTSSTKPVPARSFTSPPTSSTSRQSCVFHLCGHALIVFVLPLLSLADRPMGARRLMDLYELYSTVRSGDIPVCILWYGLFTAASCPLKTEQHAMLIFVSCCCCGLQRRRHIRLPERRCFLLLARRLVEPPPISALSRKRRRRYLLPRRPTRCGTSPTARQRRPRLWATLPNRMMLYSLYTDNQGRGAAAPPRRAEPQRRSSITGMGRGAAMAGAELHRRRAAEQHHGHGRQGRRSSAPGQGDRDPGAHGSSRETSSTGSWRQVPVTLVLDHGARGSRWRRSLAAAAATEQFLDAAAELGPGWRRSRS